MDVIQLVREAQADGLLLQVLPNGNLKIAGHESTCHKWEKQIKANKSFIIPFLSKDMLEFQSLYNFLASIAGWNDKDYQAWLKDYLSTPDEALRCLRALRCSWKEGRYGCILSNDWAQ
jgi:hypothetical protein